MKIGAPFPFPAPLPTGQEPPSPKGDDWLGGRCGFGPESLATFGLDRPAGLGFGGRQAALPREEGLTPRCPEPGPAKLQRPEDAPSPAAAEVPVPLPALPEPVKTPVPLVIDPALTPVTAQPPGPVEAPEPHHPEPAPLPESEQPAPAKEEPAGPLPPVPPQPRQEGSESRDLPPRQEQPPVAEADPPTPGHPHRPTTPAGPDDKPLALAPEAGPTKPPQPDNPPQPNVAASSATAGPGTRIFSGAPAISPELDERFADPREAYAAERSAAENAFRFDELGVFGLHGRPAGVEAPPRPPVARPAKTPLPEVAAPPVESLPALPLQRLPAEPPLPRPGRPRLDLGIKLEPQGPRPKPPEGEVSQQLPDLPVSDGDSGQSWETQAMDSAEAPAPPESVRHAASTMSPHDVVVVERSGQLLVAAMAPPLDGDGRALLRRLVRDILAGRGLSHADFQLNGISLGIDFQDITGGSHGPRAR